jgi:hypothetical protein
VATTQTDTDTLQTRPHKRPPPDGTPLTLDPAQAARVSRRLVVEGPLGAGRATMLGWLVEAGDRQRQDANAALVRGAELG